MRSRLASAPSTKARPRPTATILIRSVSWCIEDARLAVRKCSVAEASESGKSAVVLAVADAVVVAVALAFAFTLDVPSRNASLAPQPAVDVEAPMFERIVCGRRAAAGEERRAPDRRSRAGSRPAESGFGDFCQDKSHPRNSAEALFLTLDLELCS